MSDEQDATVASRTTAIAWATIWLAFVAFLALAYAIPTSAGSIIASATRPNTAQLEVLLGTVLVREESSGLEANAASGKMLVEGDVIRTTGKSQAVIWLFDGSNLRLWPDTILTVEQLRSSRFSNDRTIIVLRLEKGHARAEVALPPTPSRQIEVSLPGGTSLLREGSYSLDAWSGRSELVTHLGSASVTGAGRTVEVLKSERTSIALGQPPSVPMPGARNLLDNGDFSRGLEGWTATADAEDPVMGSTATGVDEGRSVVVFQRIGGVKHGENRIFQAINRDTTDFDLLKFRFDFKINAQSLSGGGWQGSEYPVKVRLKYRDIYDSETLLVRGFYIQNDAGNSTVSGQAVPKAQWQTFELDLLNPAQVSPRPAALLSVEVSASGWDFSSRITNAALMAE